MKTTRLALRYLALTVLFAVGLGAAGCDDGDSSLTVVNDSDFIIEELFIVPSFSGTWGPDVLGGEGLFPGEEIVVFDLECDFYDVMLIDELGAECELLDVDLCFDDATWFVSNATLNRCDQAFSSALKLAPELRSSAAAEPVSALH